MNRELDVTLLREDERALYESIKLDNTIFGNDVRVLFRRLIEERGRANRFDDALTRIIGLCAPNSKRGAHPRLDKVFGRMMDIYCQARHPEEWEKANPLPAPPEKGKKL